MSNFRLKRVYEEPESRDGRRVLIDRLWPRGMTRERIRLDDWLKEVAPSPDLRKWFGHRPERFGRFAEQYREELESVAEKRAAVKKLEQWADEGTVTLLFAARDLTHNHAVALKQMLDEKISRKRD